jgi:hypothetical protein
MGKNLRKDSKSSNPIKRAISEDSLKDAISLSLSAPSRRLLTVSIGSSVEPFYRRGSGDNYDSALLFYIAFRGGKPFYIALAVYFRDRAARFQSNPVSPATT